MFVGPHEVQIGAALHLLDLSIDAHGSQLRLNRIRHLVPRTAETDQAHAEFRAVLFTNCARPPILLRELQFVKMFLWLSRSTGEVARSRGGDEVALPLVDWGTL